MNIKKQFGIDTLLDIFALIDSKAQIQYTCESFDALNDIRNYADLLRNTTLTKEMFIGDKAIFEGFAVFEDGSDIIINNGFYKIDIWKDRKETNFSLWNVKTNTSLRKNPKTLSDLAELTKLNPLKLK